MYGSRGRIGVIDLSTCTSLTAEYGLALPDGVAAVFSRLRLPDGAVTVAALDAMVRSPRVEECAVEVADADVAVVVLACTTGTLLHGPGFDLELAARMRAATGLPATTTATAVVHALRAVGARTVAVGTPYNAELDQLERDFFEAAGFEIVHIEGLGVGDDRDIGRLSFADVERLAARVGAHRADATFLSCTNLPALPLLARLEELQGRPVFSSNAATIWESLGLIGVRPEAEGLGSLLAGGVAHPALALAAEAARP